MPIYTPPPGTDIARLLADFYCVNELLTRAKMKNAVEYIRDLEFAWNSITNTTYTAIKRYLAFIITRRVAFPLIFEGIYKSNQMELYYDLFGENIENELPVAEILSTYSKQTFPNNDTYTALLDGMIDTVKTWFTTNNNKRDARWIPIVSLYEMLGNQKADFSYVIIDHIVDVQHNKGNIFNKLHNSSEIQNVIEIKTKVISGASSIQELLPYCSRTLYQISNSIDQIKSVTEDDFSLTPKDSVDTETGESWYDPTWYGHTGRLLARRTVCARGVVADKILSMLDNIAQSNNEKEAAVALTRLASDLELYGVAATGMNISGTTLIQYIYDSIMALVAGNDVSTIVYMLRDKIQAAFNEPLKQENYAMANNQEGSMEKDAHVVMYNPEFDPGADTATCIEINGTIAGLAFSVTGIQSLLKKADIHVSDEYIRRTAAANGVIIAEDSSSVFKPVEYATELEKTFASQLDKPVCKGSKITYRTLIAGYRNMQPLSATAASGDFFETKSNSQLRMLLLDTLRRSQRPAQFDITRLNYMNREELIDAIHEQEAVIVKNAALEEDVIDSDEWTGDLADSADFMDEGTSYTFSDLLDYADQIDDSELSYGFEEPSTYQGLIDDTGTPIDMGTDSIQNAVIGLGGLVQTDDGAFALEKTPEGYEVSSSLDDIVEIFSEQELDNAIEYFQELLARHNITAMQRGREKIAASLKEVTDLSKVPTKEEVEWAKKVLNAEYEKQQALAKAIADFKVEMEKKLGISELSEPEMIRAQEIILKKLHNFKSQMMKISDKRRILLQTVQAGGTQTVAQFAKKIAEHFGAELSVIKNIQKQSTTPTWEKEFPVIMDDETGDSHAFDMYINKTLNPPKKSHRIATASFENFLNWANDFFEGLQTIVEMENTLNTELSHIVSMN